MNVDSPENIIDRHRQGRETVVQVFNLSKQPATLDRLKTCPTATIPLLSGKD